MFLWVWFRAIKKVYGSIADDTFPIPATLSLPESARIRYTHTLEYGDR
jgi:hypothetical protein